MTIDPRLQRIVVAQPYPLLFATISGAHLYGFPSADSDFDLRGVHVLPLEKVVGLQVRDETIEDLRLNQAPMKLLFVCSRNRMRSLTAEKLLEGVPGFQARSVGTQPDARIVVTEGHLGWADLVVCMEKSHLNRLRRKFPEAMQNKRAVCLHILDDYAFMQAELIDELSAKLANYVEWP